jgi:nucleotide-binding universal stress UspA family protein
MASDDVKYIVCAVRGRPASRATVSRAIDLALEHQARLTFLYVSDAQFLEYATIGPLSVVYKELLEMARFTMLILCDRARRRGVEDVNYLVLEGNLRKQLRQFAIDTSADLLIMGVPIPGTGKKMFTQKELDQFIQEVERESSLRVIQVRPDEVELK